jgi:hypothetical protein
MHYTQIAIFVRSIVKNLNFLMALVNDDAYKIGGRVQLNQVGGQVGINTHYTSISHVLIGSLTE